jgi:hypothetical protein
MQYNTESDQQVMLASAEFLPAMKVIPQIDRLHATHARHRYILGMQIKFDDASKWGSEFESGGMKEKTRTGERQ